MKLYERVKTLSEFTNNLAKKLAFILLSAITIIILMEVVFRYIRILDVSWAEELAKMLAVWLALIGASSALREGLHIGLRFLVDKIPSMVARNIISSFVSAIVLFFLVLLMVYGFIYSDRAAQQTAPGVKISMRWPLMSVPIGALFISIQALPILLRNILNFRKTSEGKVENYPEG